jgi:hypothetical protein
MVSQVLELAGVLERWQYRGVAVFSACNAPACSRRVRYDEAEPDLMTPDHWLSRKMRSLDAACQRATGGPRLLHKQCGYTRLVHVHVANGPWPRIVVSDLGFMLVLYDHRWGICFHARISYTSTYP